MPDTATLPASNAPSRLDHILNLAVVLLLLADMWMAYSLLDADYVKHLNWKTSEIKGDGPMGPKAAFWYWMENWLTPMLLVLVPSNLALAFVHVPRIFKKPSILNDVALTMEGSCLLLTFAIAVPVYF